MLEGSALRVATLRVSPSALEMLSVLSSEPRASRLASLHAPHVIACEEKDHHFLHFPYFLRQTASLYLGVFADHRHSP